MVDSKRKESSIPFLVERPDNQAIDKDEKQDEKGPKSHVDPHLLSLTYLHLYELGFLP